MKHFIIAIFALSYAYSSEPLEEYKIGKFIDVKQIAHEITIDGAIVEKEWAGVEWIEDFTQSEPAIFKSPSYKTWVKVVYNENSLFIAARMFSPTPISIKQKISPRDDWEGGFEEQSDWFSIDIDSRHSHSSGYSFIVNASGVQADQLIFDGDIYDSEWDAVWSSAVKIDDLGWVVEVEIPFSMLRFEKGDEYVWGINFSRYIYELDEHISWVVIPEDYTNVVSGFGHLGNIRGIYPPSRFEIIPYVLVGAVSNYDFILNDYDIAGSGYYRNIESRYDRKAGLNVKYKINTSNLVDFVINPDFGQIDSDPSSINLTSYETYFDDRRPFFNEGMEVFSTPVELFYSRRVGQDSWQLDTLRDGKIRWAKVPTAIISATKATGKIGRVTYGLISAASSSDKTSNNNPLDYFSISPNIFQSVFRTKLDIGKSGSFVGYMGTYNNFRDRVRSVHAVDSKIDASFKIFDFSITPQFLYSSGSYGFYNRSDIRVGGNIDLWTEYKRFESGLGINDLGYLWRDDSQELSTGAKIGSNQRMGPIRRFSLILSYDLAKNLDGLVNNNLVDLSLATKLMNGWLFGTRLYRAFEHSDDRLIWIDDDLFGPPVRVSEIDGIGLSLNTPNSNSLSLGYDYSAANNLIGDKLKEHDIRLSYSPNASFDLSFEYNRYDLKKSFQYIESVTEEIYSGNNFVGDTTHYIFSKINHSNESYTVRADKYFDEDRSIRLYAEYYRNYDLYDLDYLSEQMEPNEFPSYESGYFGQMPPLYSENPGEESYLSPNLYIPFYPSYNSFLSTIVYKWTYREGSDIYLVYSYNRIVNGKRFSSLIDFINYQFKDDFVEIYNNHSFFIKLSFWFER